MPAYTYRAMWPILDQDRPVSALIAEAAAALDAQAATDGARILGTTVWTVAGQRLVCEAPAEPLDGDMSPEERATVVMRLAGLHWSYRQIEAATGVPASTARDIVQRHGRAA